MYAREREHPTGERSSGMAQGDLQERNGVRSGIVTYGTNGGTVDGYLARPADNAAHPGVILIQEWWGIEPHIKEMAERLARQGYAVLAPDLYHGQVAQEPNEAMKHMMALNRDAAVKEISKGIDYLQTQGNIAPNKVGVVGFCMGGHLAWTVAEREDGEIAAVAPFYAGYYQPTADDIKKVTAPVMVVWGEQDDSIPLEQRQRIVQLLQQEGQTYKALTYSAGHAFMTDQHDAHDAAAAQAAWNELLSWFKQYLG
jgi:carboxymethylenebutenolidase